ncbi:unnamed protein product [Brassica rapa subsp. narinosa]
MAEFKRNLTLVTTLSILLQLCSIVSCTTSTSITRNNTIRDGDALISEEEVFELGFFSPKDSTLRYVGIWYKNIEPQTIVWVANRERPLSDHNGALKLVDDGNLVVVDGQNNTVWSTNVPPKLNNTVAVLLETGDLVLSSDSDRDTRFWESFNNPTDTFLPGMRVRVNPTSGENRAFTPWMSETDPSPGRYSLGIDPIGPPEIVIWEGETRKWRSGPWDSVIFTGIPDMFRVTNYIRGFKLSAPPERDGSVYFTYVPSDSSDLLRFQITFDSVIEQFRWNKDAKNWTLLLLKPSTECEKYNRCGNYSVCDESKEFGSGKCSCIDGFEPVNQNLWDDGDFSGGCKRRVPLNCSQSLREDEFMELRGMKLPDFGSFVSLRNSETCKDVCVRDCLCNAYAFVRGIGCMIWTRDLIDMERFQHGGQSINIRLAESELGGKENSKLWIIILSVIGAFLLVLCIWTLWKFKKRVRAILWRKKHLPVFEENKYYSVKSSSSTSQVLVGGLVDTPDFPIFSFNSVALATGNFAEENKLGQGGFGTVYKGNFPGDTEIAVKRLSGKSKQGLEEFKNEILLIAKLQHRNLVRLVGCCIENNEKILLYEYMPNKSLDSFLFDESKRGSLDWKKRWDIIGGIARGLLYLHRDSRLKIIHRDLKASNILLDKEMNPKISDFGMARIFNYRQDQANTIRVVGTYGYMAPEYAMEGMFSDKSDVYSFGVLILEIVSGSKNFSFRGSEHGSLIGYAWNLWSQGKTKELIDPTVKDTQDVNEAMRCIHVGMLCTQDSVIYRPNIGSVLLMLESRMSNLPRPRQPTFHSFLNSGEIVEGQDVATVNDITLTTVTSEDQIFSDMAKFKRNLTSVTTLLILLQLCSIVSCIRSTLITRNNTIRDGDTLISEEEVFELGFFSPKDSTLRYVGIWYKNIQPQTIVWVANRERPLSDQNGAIKLADDGNLVVVDGKNNTVWSTNVPPKLNNTVAVLLKTGDLVLSSDSDRDTRFWESFNNPTDTFLPGMRVRVNPSSGENHAFIPWKSETDPSPGRYSMGIDPFGAIEIVIWEGETRKWRSGPWNSAIFTGVPDMFHFTNYIHGFKLSSPPDPDGSVFLTYVPSNKDDLSRFRIRFDGIVEQLRWNRDARNWTSLQVKPSKECEKYNRCGNYSVCNDSKDFDSSKCSCIYGFEPAYQNQWNNGNFSGGCIRRVPLNCSDKVDGFRVLKGMKVPDFGSVVSLNQSGTCKDVCMRDCSCKAYEVVPGIGCMIWTRDLIDMEHFEHGGNSINIRLAASEIGGTKEISKFWIIIFSTIGALMFGLCCLCIWILWRFRKRVKDFLWKNRDSSVKPSRSRFQVLVGDQVDTPDFPTFSFNSVASATGDFSEENKLGQGGFGTVYKGNFPGGREIAVKRLSGKSKQGLEEFRNEISLIAKLQHRNLVRLLGCCIENDEKILLYEYMPNNSLDHFLFDETKQRNLEWRKRWDIIGGIARGLLYLHRDSRLKIIHRDLKASNILLDKEINPKISDFGMARIFNYRQDQANTIRVVGT